MIVGNGLTSVGSAVLVSAGGYAVSRSELRGVVADYGFPRQHSASSQVATMIVAHQELSADDDERDDGVGLKQVGRMWEMTVTVRIRGQGGSSGNGEARVQSAAAFNIDARPLTNHAAAAPSPTPRAGMTPTSRLHIRGPRTSSSISSRAQGWPVTRSIEPYAAECRRWLSPR